MNKYIIICVVCVSVFACADQVKTSQVLKFANPNEFYQVIQSLKGKLDKKKYTQLTDSIGKLRVFDTKHITLESFYQSINGLSIDEIIAKSNTF